LTLAIGLGACAAGADLDSTEGGGVGGKADDASSDPAAPPPFMIIGHRGSPWAAVENTLPSYTAALREGANAIELDLCVTADHQVVAWHDCNPDNVVALARQIGAEGLPFIPEVPEIRNPWRTNIRNLTLAEVREHYGYAPNTVFVDSTFDTDGMDVHIPTLDEVADWARTDDGRAMRALFLDIKLAETDLDLVPVLAEKVRALFGDAPFAIFMMSPSEPVVTVVRDWFEVHAPVMNDGLMYDFEKNGALDAARRMGLSSLSTGRTPLREWDDYYDEMISILDHADESIDTIVSWTIDDENQMLALVGLGVDGVITNRPADLARLVDRAWDDHDRVIQVIADCYAAHVGSSEGAQCATGSELGLFGSLREAQLVRRACAASADEIVRDVFGCGGPFNAQNVTFDTDVLADDAGGIWWNGYSGEVLVSSW